MGDWPMPQESMLTDLGTSLLNSVALEASRMASTTPSSAGAYAANEARFYPCVVSQPMRLARAWVMTGGTSSGNYDIGLYDTEGNRLCSTGSTAMGAALGTVGIALTAATTVLPGVYYLALAADNATATVTAYATLAAAAALGALAMASAFALPTTATFAATAGAQVPVFGLTTRSFP